MSFVTGRTEGVKYTFQAPIQVLDTGIDTIRNKMMAVHNSALDTSKGNQILSNQYRIRILTLADLQRRSAELENYKRIFERKKLELDDDNLKLYYVLTALVFLVYGLKYYAQDRLRKIEEENDNIPRTPSTVSDPE